MTTRLATERDTFEIFVLEFANEVVIDCVPASVFARRTRQLSRTDLAAVVALSTSLPEAVDTGITRRYPLGIL